MPCRWYLAQQYISSPLLINSCKFGVRVWVLVLPELAPLRAYMHTNGLVLFSSQRWAGVGCDVGGADVVEAAIIEEVKYWDQVSFWQV